MYNVRAAASDGGGHVQTANRGGTGQTAYTLGDILVATSSSVLARLAVGSEREVLAVRAAAAAGVAWSSVIANKETVNTASVAFQGSILTTLYAGSILGSTLGTNNAVKFTGFMQDFGAVADFTLIANYGNNVVASVITIATLGGTVGLKGIISGAIVADGGVSLQRGHIAINGSVPHSRTAAGSIVTGYGFGTASVNSSANQNLIITGQFAGPGSLGSILTGSFIVERIQ